MTIKIGIVSDLHTEFWRAHHFGGVGAQLQQTLKDADLLLLAGDIGSGADGIANAIRLFPDKPICLVAGNHEFYGADHAATIEQMRAATLGTQVSFLQQDTYSATIHGQPIRVLGATLWTDFALFGTPPISMWSGQRALNDFRLIQHQGARLTPAATAVWHAADRAWLLEQIETPFDGTTIVMTHHAPVSFSIAPHFATDSLSPCFASRLDDLLIRDGIDLVVWGHTHHVVDRKIDSTRFVSNQTGYVRSNDSGSVETGHFGVVIEI